MTYVVISFSVFWQLHTKLHVHIRLAIMATIICTHFWASTIVIAKISIPKRYSRRGALHVFIKLQRQALAVPLFLSFRCSAKNMQKLVQVLQVP